MEPISIAFLFSAVVQFEEYVLPSSILIYQTYNPGAIIRLYAYTITEQWICLWKNEGALETQFDQSIFKIDFKHIKEPTK